MYTITNYVTESGRCPYDDFLKLIDKQSPLRRTELETLIKLLKKHGKNINKYSANAIKYLSGDIWELRPKANRVLFFFFTEDKIIFLGGHKKSETKKSVQRCIAQCQERANRYKTEMKE